MSIISNYIKSYRTSIRYIKSVSLMSVWWSTDLNKNVYIAEFVRLGYSKIGKYTRIRQFATIYHTKIGNFSSIGRNVKIGVGAHPTDLVSTNLIFYKQNPIKNDFVKPILFEEYKETTIGNDVWIGEHATIIGGIKIGNGAIVATKAVVTKDIPAYSIVGGVPAKILGYRFSEDIRNALEDSKWWDLSDNEILEKIEIFTKKDLSMDDIKSCFCKS